MSKRFNITIYILLAVLLLLVIAAAVIIAVGTNSEIGELEGENAQLEAEGDKLTSTVNRLQSQKSRLESEIAELNARITELEAKLADSGKYYTDEIEALKLQVEQKNTAIAELEADIARYETVYKIDVLAQARLIDDIIEYIETMTPYVRMVAPPKEADAAAQEPTADSSEEKIEYIWVKIDDLIDKEIEARKELGEDAEALYTPEELEADSMTEDALIRAKLREKILARDDVFYPSVSVYYEDLTTGYHFEYAEDAVYPAASVIKAPYVMSVLKAISEDEKAFFEKVENDPEFLPEMVDTDEDGIPDKTIIEYSDPKFELSEIVKYDSKTMLKEGSGKIKDMPDGTEFTYIDFIKYALEYSDNVAYQQLKNRFKYDRYYALARSVGATASARNANNMTAADAGKMFKAIYEFIEEDETYGPLLRESMSKANHTVLIPYAVSPTKALHKYGWDIDSYHDAAIVESGDKPYVLAVFSDLDMGGEEVNAYLSQIIKMINKLHKGFYGN